MNIVFVTPQLKFGGYEKVVINYANSFSKLGHNVTVICGFKSGQYVELLESKINLIEFKARLRIFLLPLTRYLKDNKVDILYVPFHSYTSIAVIARKLSKNKCIIYGSSHGYQPENNKIIDYLVGKIVKQADVLVTVTKDLAIYESKIMFIPNNKFRVFNNPVVDDSVVIQKEDHKWLGKNKKNPVVVISGRLEVDKRKDISIKIINKVLKKCDIRLLVLGDGSKMNELVTLTKKYGIEDKVDFLGFVENPMSYMIQCDIFLHTAEIEAFGNVIVEALYCGLPVVTTDCRGPVDIIENNKYGIVIGKVDESGTIDRGCEAIINILNHKILFKNLKNRALEFDGKYLEKDFLKPYYEIMGDKNG